MLRDKFPFYKQLDMKDCGPTCLRMITRWYGRSIPIVEIRQLANLTNQGSTIGDLAEASERIGFHSFAARINFSTLVDDTPVPFIAHWKGAHFVVVYKASKKSISIADPAQGKLKYTPDEFVKAWTGDRNAGSSAEGNVLMLEPTPKFYESEDKKSESASFGINFITRYLKPHRGALVQLIFGLIIGSLLQLIFPFLTQAVVDYGIAYQNIDFVFLIMIAQVVLFISQASVDLIRGWILLHMTTRINVSLISDFLLKLMWLPISFFDSKNTGDIFQRINDHNRIQSFLSNTSLHTLFSLFNVLIFGVVLAYYSLTIFAIFFSGSFLYITWTLLFLKRRASLDSKRFAQNSENSNSLLQLVTGMQEIKLNGSERRRRWEWEAVQAQLFKISTKGLALSQIQSTGSSFLFQLQNIVITFIAARTVISGELTLGMMLSIQYIIGQLNGPINSFLAFIQAAQDARLSFERLSEIHNKENEEQDVADHYQEIPAKKTIRVENVSFRYGGQHSPLILDNVSLVIPEGKITAIVGSSGSGKTTLLKLLLKFYEPTEGKISIGETDLKNISAKKWRRLCGVVMQEGFVFNDSIGRNITESDSEAPPDRERIVEAAQIANIRNFIEANPQGYNLKIGPKGTTLSSGQKQRILIARAVYKNPAYIFFDEATSALDTGNEAAIMANLKRFYKGRTVIIVAHRLSTVRNADQIVVVERGRIIEAGNHLDLAAKKGSYYDLVRNQLELEN